LVGSIDAKQSIMNVHTCTTTIITLKIPSDENKIKFNTKNFRNHIVKADPAITQHPFLNCLISSELQVTLGFEPLDKYPTMPLIMSLAKQLMNFDWQLLNQTFKATCLLMKENDSMLKSIIGKTIVIPYTFYKGYGYNPRSVIFIEMSETDPKWEIAVVETKDLQGKNAVLPVLTKV
jgi:hypothetical protein